MRTHGEGVLLAAIVMLVVMGQVAANAQPRVREVCARFYLDGAPVRVRIDPQGVIAAVERPAACEGEAEQLYVAPGLIDNQVNGYAGVSFAEDTLKVEDVRRATRALWKTGVTTYVPTLITAPRHTLVHSLRVLAQAMRDPEIALSVRGFHLEGPYISPEDGYRGAHVRDWVRPPDWNEFEELQRAADGKILEVSLAPEVNGALDFIRRCRQAGVLVALAHHNAPAEVIHRAADNGARLSTHLGNGCANLIHRHDNPLWPQLADDRLAISIIADGFHLRPDQVRVFYRVKGPERVILVSDMIALAGLPPGEYEHGGRRLVVDPAGVVRYPEQNVLAGASQPLAVGVANVMRFTGCSLAEAIHMASRNPARLLGFTDLGEIAPGNRADLILFRLRDTGLEIVKTIVAGQVVHDPSAH
ncbi:MAG: N-acetylglucosamine-6-phosphate deacetylase [candidate division KSB1 bacterium]|nr:N-acetylglucosamine-6-phosphate deacetylase [candidate division KSB1 bacterium]